MSDCQKCRHPEAEHKPLGCVHEMYSEQRIEHGDGDVTTATDLSVCGCEYFRG